MSGSKEADGYTYDAVVSAINLLYQGNSKGQQSTEEASRWLDKFQKSIYSWQICNDILHHCTDLNCGYFAAQTMRSKIKYQFHELPPATHQDFKVSLFHHLNNQCGSSPQVVTQLCLAIADLALQMVQWKKSLQEIIMTLSQSSGLMENLLEILFVIPEEVNNKSLRLGQNRRVELVGEWEQCRKEILEFFASCLTDFEAAGNWRLAGKVVAAFGQWWTTRIFADGDFADHRGYSLLLSPFRLLVKADCPSSVHESASECLCNMFYGAENVDMFPSLMPVLLQSCLQLEETYLTFVAAEDLDRCLDICRVWTDLAHTLIPKITGQPNSELGSFKTLELLLSVVGHPSREMAQYTLSFWYSFALAVADIKEANREQFKPYLERVMVALVKHCQYCGDGSDYSQDTSGFADFRERVTELLEDVLYLVEPERLLCTMFSLLKQFGAETADWRVTESVLFLLSVIIHEVSPQESQVTTQLLAAVLALPRDSPTPMLLTGLSFLGKLALWASAHTEWLGALMPMLLGALHSPALASTAAAALAQYCTFCKAQMQEQFAGLLQVAESLPTTAGLKADAAQQLLRGIVLVLSRLDDPQQMSEGLQRLCNVQIAGLQSALASGDNEPVLWLDCLATLFRDFRPGGNCDQAHPGLPVMRAVWPSLEQTLDAYPENVRVVERACRVIRYQVRCLRRACAPLLPQLADRIMRSYATCPHSCFLYLAGILTDEFGQDPACQPGLVHMLEAMMGPTLATLDGSAGLAQNPDMAEDLFRLCTRFLQRCPECLLGSAALLTIFQLAVGSLEAEHRDAIASVTKFLQELLLLGTQPLGQATVRSLLMADSAGANLTSVLLHSAVLRLSSYSIPDVAEVLHQLLLLDKATVSGWLREAMLQLPNTRADGLVQATPAQIEHFHSALANCSDSDPGSVIQALQQLCQLYK